MAERHWLAGSVIGAWVAIAIPASATLAPQRPGAATPPVAERIAPPASSTPVHPRDHAADADALLAASYPADGPGVAVMIARDGKVQ